VRFVTELVREPGDRSRGATGMTDAESLPTAKSDGLYQVGKSRFRVKRGDKIPANAKLVKPEDDAKAIAAAKAKRENTKATGPRETT
jgi:hypothetical protein